MNKAQLYLIGLAVLLFVLLFFVFKLDKPALHTDKNLKSQLCAEFKFEEEKFKENSLKNISADNQNKLNDLESKLKSVQNTNEVELLKSISAFWYQNKQVLQSAIYAEKIAEILKNEEAWSISGGNYFESLKNENDECLRAYITNKAVSCFENASKLDTSDISNKVNIALCFVENPPKDNPMKGILSLRELDSKYPNNPLVLTNLGRLAIKTGQFDKAVERLNQVLKVDPTNLKANCLIAEAYRGLKDNILAESYDKKCQTLSK
jgi:tetratricopeptide (TPR) repeat protein